MRTALRLVVPLLGLVAVTGCSGSSSPSTSAFHAGNCRDSAAAVLQAGAAAGDLGSSDKPPTKTLDALKKAQTTIEMHLGGSGPEVPALTSLTQAIGFVRIRSVGSSYDPTLGTAVKNAYKAAVASCTS